MQRHYPLNPATGLEDAALLPWTNGNPTTGTEGSYPPFGLFTDPQDEILSAIAGTGQTPGSSVVQLLQAIARGIFLGAVGGTANALSAAIPGSVQIPALTAGMRFSALIAAPNTGSTTLTLTGFGTPPGAKNVTRVDGSPLQAADIVTGEIVTLVYDGTQYQVEHLNPAVIPARGFQIFTSSGTFTPGPGVYFYEAQVWAAGAAGGGASGTTASAVGGGGGEFRWGTFPCLPGVSKSVTVGVGGTGGAGGGTPATGGNGGSSSVGSDITAVGGNGGGPSGGGVAVTGGLGGSGGAGGIGIPGRSAGTGFPAGSSLLSGGFGGSAFGSSNPGPSVGTAGIPGVFPGGGGNGSSASANGGNGANGLVIIRS